MTLKPVVIYIEDDNHTSASGNQFRDSLRYVMENDFGVEVIGYLTSFHFRDNFATAKHYLQNKRLILLIVNQDRYVYPNELGIEFVRENLSADLPVVVMPNGFDDERFKGNPEDTNLYCFSHSSPQLLLFVERLVKEWQGHFGWLGADTSEEVGILMSQLENAYRTNYLGENDSQMWGTPDINHMIVAEALRIKLLPSECLMEEFDKTLKYSKPEYEVVINETYQNELQRIRSLSTDERKKFQYAMIRAEGNEPVEGGGVFVNRLSKGKNISGFAIDPETFETKITTTFGLHHAAAMLLAYRIVHIEEIRKRMRGEVLSQEEEWDCERRLIGGLIFDDVFGFSTPILKLYGHNTADPYSDEDFSKVADYLIEKQQFIPVDYEGNLIKG